MYRMKAFSKSRKMKTSLFQLLLAIPYLIIIIIKKIKISFQIKNYKKKRKSKISIMNFPIILIRSII